MASIIKELTGVHVGDTTSMTYKITNKGTDVDITGATMVLYLRQTDGTTVLTKTTGFTLSAPTAGEFTYTHLAGDWDAKGVCVVQAFATLASGGVFKSDWYHVIVDANLA